MIELVINQLQGTNEYLQKHKHFLEESVHFCTDLVKNKAASARNNWEILCRNRCAKPARSLQIKKNKSLVHYILKSVRLNKRLSRTSSVHISGQNSLSETMQKYTKSWMLTLYNKRIAT